MIKIENVTKSYKSKYGERQVVLDNTSFSFKKGVKTFILGHSGSGKTTLLNLLGGLDNDFSGELLFDSNTITDFDKYRRENISFIFQNSNLISHLNLIDNITNGITNDIEDKHKVALALLDKVGLLDHAYKLPNQLSGGEMQRVAIARALARDTDILLCDEPTGNLDDDTTEEIMKLIMEVSKDKTVIVITHDEELAKKYSDEIITVESKKIVISKSYEKEFNERNTKEIIQSDPHLKLGTAKINKNFNGRFYRNLLAKKNHLIQSSILIILMSSLFLLGTGINKGLIDSVDDYIINTYKIDKINLQLVGKPMGFKGMQYVIDQENDKNGKNIVGFMVSKSIDTYIGDFHFDDNATLISKDDNFNDEQLRFFYGENANIIRIDSSINNAYLLNASIKKSMEKDIAYGKYPENANEIIYSKGNSIRAIVKDRYDPKMGEKEQERLLEEILNFSDEQLFNEVKKLEFTYIVNASKHNPTFKIVGIVDDYKYIDHYDVYEKYVYFFSNRSGFDQFSYTAKNINDSKMNNNVYLLEDDFTQIQGGKDKYNSAKYSAYSLFINEEDPKLRQKVFNSIIGDNTHLYRGDDLVLSEYKKYVEYFKDYRVGILVISILLALLGCIVIYNSIKTITLKNIKNIGIYRSLGYTSKNIQSMFVKEGIIISTTITLISLFVWLGMNFYVNDTLVLLLDSTGKLGFDHITKLSFYSVIILFLVINVFVISPILRILNVKNIINIL